MGWRSHIRGLRPLPSLRRCGRHGAAQGERCATVGVVLDAHRPSVRFHDPQNDGKAEAGTRFPAWIGAYLDDPGPFAWAGLRRTIAMPDEGPSFESLLLLLTLGTETLKLLRQPTDGHFSRLD